MYHSDRCEEIRTTEHFHSGYNRDRCDELRTTEHYHSGYHSDRAYLTKAELSLVQERTVSVLPCWYRRVAEAS